MIFSTVAFHLSFQALCSIFQLTRETPLVVFLYSVVFTLDSVPHLLLD